MSRLTQYRYKFLVCLLVCIPTFSSFAHSDFDKARFVSVTGTDEGRCNNRFRPCKTIAYAYSRANKGDVILVAEGQYELPETLSQAIMSTDLITIRGGYSLTDHYLVQHPNQHVTQILTSTQSFASQLFDSGFSVIADGKSSQTAAESALVEQTPVELSQSALSALEEQPCVNNIAAGFACDNISLLANVPLSAMPTNSFAANDVWGHVDLNTGREYAIIGLQRGVVVLDVSEPTSPVVVGSVAGLSTTWRDIKIIQIYNAAALRWQAWAYVTADALSTGLFIIDLNDLENGVRLVAQDTTDLNAHNVYISGVDYSLNIPLLNATPQLNIVGSNNFGGALRSYDISEPSSPQTSFSPVGSLRSDYTHDASSLEINDARAQANCGQSTGETCSVLLDFNENSLRIHNSSDVANTSLLSEISYANVQYTHSGWWSEDKRYVFVHDELDETGLGINTSVYIFDITDLQSPQQVGTWVGPTAAIDHNGFVRGNRYYISNYERGLTVLDISDPTSPEQIGFFDTFPNSNNAAFNGAWGAYPYLPSGNILVSDRSRGLFVLRDESAAQNSTIAIQPALEVAEGETVSLSVSRVNGIGAASVEYSLVPGSADTGDVDAISGELQWAINDNEDKLITFDVTSDGIEEADEQFFVVLSNPQGTFVAGSGRIANVSISGVEQVGQASILQNTLTLLENQAAQTLSVSRTGGSSGELRLPVDLGSGSDDVTVTPNELIWQDGETTTFTIIITPVDDNLTEGDEVVTINIGSASASVTILDDESNNAPVVNAGEDVTANARAAVTVTGSATDADNDTLTYEWRQLSGTQVNLINADTPVTEFTAPNEESTIELQLTVSDIFSAQNTDTVVVSVSAPVVASEPEPSNDQQQSDNGSGGGSIYLNLFYLMVLVVLRRRKDFQH